VYLEQLKVKQYSKVQKKLVLWDLFKSLFASFDCLRKKNQIEMKHLSETITSCTPTKKSAAKDLLDEKEIFLHFLLSFF
jgi:hypothetical protein